jgi:hypothetical protein
MTSLSTHTLGDAPVPAHQLIGVRAHMLNASCSKEVQY